ncbi:MAG: molybdopterin converting factor subunit 1 [Hyphomicrobium sp.]
MPSSGADSQVVTLRYFAWVREAIGRSEERLSLPSFLITVADVVHWLRARGPEYEVAFQKPDAIRVALDHVHAKPDAHILGVREIGFFPPITGG